MFKPEIYQVEAVAEELINSATDWQADELAYWSSRMHAAVRDLEQRLLSRYLNAIKDQPLRRYVRFHQRYLIRLSDRIFDFRNKNRKTKRDAPMLVDEILTEIDEILDRAASCMGQDFDLYSPVSRFAAERSSQIRYAFTIESDQQIDATLLETISASLNAPGKPGYERRPTYQELQYAGKISTIVVQLLKEPETSTYSLFGRLYMENFNDPAFALWYQQEVLEKIEGLSATDRLQVLDAELKRLQLTGIPPKRAFHEDRLSIFEELTSWLSKLIGSSIDGFNSSVQKLPLELPVTQLGLFLRLCHQTGCFHEHNVSGILRFFSQHFMSKKQAHVSQKSLAKAFYGADQSTAANCRAWLLQMVDHINKRYFPK